ncbi:MAG: FCD domain-containing protein, partial [Mycobacterium sp.]|nr:FCD domain-containing protein [Mycobacterium sp.]
IQLMDAHADPDPWVSHNARFHHILEGACRNAQLAGTMRRLADLSQVYVAMCERVTPRHGHANHVHRQILDAYRRRDVDEAIDRTLRHITDTQELARNEFKRMRDAAKRAALAGETSTDGPGAPTA